MTRYTAAEREEAALICAIAASGGVYSDHYGRYLHNYADVAAALDVSGLSVEIALGAYYDVSRCFGIWTREVDAEAEALIRNGEI